MGEPFRLEPQMQPGAYQTFQVVAPLSTHWAPATCAEVDCGEYANGWRLRVEGLTEQDVHLATHCGRKFERVPVAPGETWLVFEAGQPCFKASQHRKRIDREERYIIRGGDHRANPGGERRETSATGWLDDFGEHQDQLAERLERG
jgi:hypothetical protein